MTAIKRVMSDSGCCSLLTHLPWMYNSYIQSPNEKALSDFREFLKEQGNLKKKQTNKIPKISETILNNKWSEGVECSMYHHPFCSPEL